MRVINTAQNLFRIAESLPLCGGEAFAKANAGVVFAGSTEQPLTQTTITRNIFMREPCVAVTDGYLASTAQLAYNQEMKKCGAQLSAIVSSLMKDLIEFFATHLTICH
jgi:hypothetical protein